MLHLTILSEFDNQNIDWLNHLDNEKETTKQWFTCTAVPAYFGLLYYTEDIIPNTESRQAEKCSQHNYKLHRHCHVTCFTVT